MIIKIVHSKNYCEKFLIPFAFQFHFSSKWILDIFFSFPDLDQQAFFSGAL